MAKDLYVMCKPMGVVAVISPVERPVRAPRSLPAIQAADGAATWSW